MSERPQVEIPIAQQLSDLLGSEEVQKTVAEIIVAEVGERLRFNGQAYGTPWNGERADTEFLVGDAPQQALAAVYAAFSSEPTDQVGGDAFTPCPSRRDHEWDEGDEGAVYCSKCGGYRCSTCNGSGLFDCRRCFRCSGSGVEAPEDPGRLPIRTALENATGLVDEAASERSGAASEIAVESVVAVTRLTTERDELRAAVARCKATCGEMNQDMDALTLDRNGMRAFNDLYALADRH